MPGRETARLVTAKDLARTLGLSLGTIYKMAREGRIPAIRVGTGRVLRFDPDDVRRALASASGTARPPETRQPDPLFGIHDLAVETGLKNLAEHHDHYLYGTPVP